MNLKEKVVFILEKNRGSFVSGQDIAKEANVSRSAVAKCVALLKSEGYQIRSVNNQGHMLENECDILSTAAIKAYFDDELKIETFKTIDSTNSEAKRAVSSGLNDDAIFAAEHQTDGRGRRGRSFYSPDGSGLYFSVVLHPNASLEDSVGITAAAAVAVAEALREATKKDPKIKWVNDIFIGGKKVCGILTEAVSDFESGTVEAVIIGVGINLTTTDFPAELKSIAGSVGENINRCKLIADIFKRLKGYCSEISERRFMEDYRKYSLVIGNTVYFTRNGTDYTATADNITDSGALEVTCTDGEKMILNSGEISIKL